LLIETNIVEYKQILKNSFVSNCRVIQNEGAKKLCSQIEKNKIKFESGFKTGGYFVV
jgi:hypothetical protein